ncbi:MAG: glycosyltransferase family 39 protein [Myxococcota bacterium]
MSVRDDSKDPGDGEESSDDRTGASTPEDADRGQTERSSEEDAADAAGSDEATESAMDSDSDESTAHDPDDSKSGDASAESKSPDSKGPDSKSPDSKSRDSKSGESVAGDAKAGDAKAGDAKAVDAKVGDADAGDSDAGDSENGESAVADAKADSETTDSKNNSEIGDSKSSDSKSDDASKGDTAANRKSPPGLFPKLTGSRAGRSIALIAVFGISTFLLMANAEQIPHGPLYGFFTLALTVLGILDLLGLFSLKDPDAVPLLETSVGPQTYFGTKFKEPIFLTPLVTVPVAILIVVGGFCVAGYDALPTLILAGLLVMAPSAICRPGLLVFVVMSAVYLPLLGTYGLWDPWETHYGEVAREILARDDWISLWWAQDGWFWSKPILIFWSEALTMGFLNVEYLPDTDPYQPEWAIRLPIYTFAICALLAVYHSISRVFSRRAGVLAALVLGTMPHFFFLAHQSITDMPFVANMTVAMAMLIAALRESPDAKIRNIRIGSFTLSGQHLVLGLLLMIVLPQALYLISRNITFVDYSKFAWHEDVFMHGSAGNSGNPGNAAAYDARAYVPALQPIVQGFFWLTFLGLIVLTYARERRAKSLYMLVFYIYCGVAFMGKGIPGFALPGMVALLYLIASRRWNELLAGNLRVAIGALTTLVVGLPWYVAMYLRHGPPFTDRLLVHDHINRLAAGVHGDNGTIEYFMEQLGVALFPWVAIVPAGLTMWFWFRSRQDTAENQAEYHQRQTLILLLVWFAGAFTLFSAMITKFHHYIFPTVPAAGIVAGLVLDRLFGAPVGRGSYLDRVGVNLLCVLSPIPVIIGVAGLWGNVRGVIPREVPLPERAEWVFDHGMDPTAAFALVFLGVSMAAAAWFLTWHWRPAHGDAQPGDEGAWKGVFSVLLIAGTFVVVFVGRDLSWVTDGRPQGYERLIHLFVYNYGRPWPTQFDYRPILTAFALASGVLFSLAALPFVRRFASRAMVGVGILFAAWVVNVYLVDLSPHWGQREVIKEYYYHRDSDEQRLVAWQMNWKGENFYSGNRVYAFVDLDNAKVREWMNERRGQKTFFVLEHSRLNSFRGLIGNREVIEHTDKRLNNKFILLEVIL